MQVRPHPQAKIMCTQWRIGTADMISDNARQRVHEASKALQVPLCATPHSGDINKKLDQSAPSPTVVTSITSLRMAALGTTVC